MAVCAWVVDLPSRYKYVENALTPSVSMMSKRKLEPGWREVKRLVGKASSLFPQFPGLDVAQRHKGVRSQQFLQGLQGCQSVALELVSQPDPFKTDWNKSWYFDAFNNLTQTGGKPFAGSMLVLKGTADTCVNPNGKAAAVNAACQACPDGALEYATFEGVSHVPVLYAGQQV
ncbi:hypothetical protein LTR93_000230 [Exophiala xenobiotica]|nr:hypothetical protein LTR93_000230 [Exophiala xenobiotica]KAK5418094.1 hypothetical protein LTR06_001843 [Exophiala xenobiotica]